MLAIAAALIAITSSPEPVGGLAPPADRFAHGAAGTGRNGTGGSIAPSTSAATWPGTGVDRHGRSNGGPFSFVGAQYGALWKIPAQPNNSRGIGYCVMEDVRGEGRVAKRADPSQWDASEMARAAALMATYGGDEVVPYGVTEALGAVGSTTASVADTGRYDVATGEWQHPALFGGGEYTRRRHVAVNFGVRMFVEDVSPTGASHGLKLARDTAVVAGSGGEFSALRNGYRVAQRMAVVADAQHAVDGVALTMMWKTRDGTAPTTPGRYPLEVRATDGTGKPVGYVPVLQLSGVGIGAARSEAAAARVDNTSDTAADIARWNAASAAGWPTWRMDLMLAGDERFAVGADARAADVADGRGIARFEVDITASDWELAFHVQAPTANVDLYAGTGVQGQITWSGRPQSASVHERHEVPDVHLAVAKRSSDPGVAVAGTTFALLDASRDEVGRAAVDGRGMAVFEPFSPAAAGPPYALVELTAAPGLARITHDIEVPAVLSTDPERPTVVTVKNRAITGTFVVRKTLDDDVVQGERDMSGFVFEVTQVATGRIVGRVQTGSDGATPPIAAVLGGYVVTEIDRPPWAAGLGDGGPVTLEFDPTTNPSAEIVYVNRIPDATIDTSARDAADGDRYVDLSSGDAAVIDTVDYCGLVPGTTYAATGELHVLDDDSLAEPSGVTGRSTFTPDDACGSVEVTIAVAQDAPVAGNATVVFQTLTLDSSPGAPDSPGEVVSEADGTTSTAVVAEHVDPLDSDQTVYLPLIDTWLRPLAPSSSDGSTSVHPGDRVVDEVVIDGVAAGGRYRAELTLARRNPDGSCQPTAMTASTEFVAATARHRFTVGPVTVPSAGTFVAFERVFSLEPHAGTPDAGAGPEHLVIADHNECDDADQTITVIAPPAATTTAPTPTSPTVASTVASTVAPGTSTPPTSDLPAAGTSTPTTPRPATTLEAPSRAALPRTGRGSGGMLWLAAVLALTGVGVVLNIIRPDDANEA